MLRLYDEGTGNFCCCSFQEFCSKRKVWLWPDFMSQVFFQTQKVYILRLVLVSVRFIGDPSWCSFKVTFKTSFVWFCVGLLMSQNIELFTAALVIKSFFCPHFFFWVRWHRRNFPIVGSHEKVWKKQERFLESLGTLYVSCLPHYISVAIRLLVWNMEQKAAQKQRKEKFMRLMLFFE